MSVALDSRGPVYAVELPIESGLLFGYRRGGPGAVRIAASRQRTRGRDWLAGRWRGVLTLANVMHAQVDRWESAVQCKVVKHRGERTVLPKPRQGAMEGGPSSSASGCVRWGTIFRGIMGQAIGILAVLPSFTRWVGGSLNQGAGESG